MKEITTYKDYRDRETELTPDELNWFHDIVNRAKSAAGYADVTILAYDHELIRGHEEALGICHTENPDDPLLPESHTYITIDCYFINECYRAAVCGDFKITSESLEEVIAHELAHLTVWRHGKRHSRETKRLLERIIPEKMVE